MAKFDVYEQRDAPGLVLDCQADLLDDLSTRFVVPLVPPGEIGRQLMRLNPIFNVGGDDMVMATQFAATVDVKDLGRVVASLIGDDTKIIGALDMLLSGV